MAIQLKEWIGLLLFVIFFMLSAIHFYWALGGKWGMDAAIPAGPNNEKIIRPGMLACFGVALALLGFGLFVLIKSGMVSAPLPGWTVGYGPWIISILFALRAIGEFK